MASRKKSFRKVEEAFEDDDNCDDKDLHSYWKSAGDRFRVSQKQSAWTENEVNDQIPSTSRGISSLENRDHLDVAKEPFGISLGEKNRGRGVKKKKGRIHEFHSRPRSGMQEEDRRSEIFPMKSLERREELSRRAEVSVSSLSELVRGEEESGESHTTPLSPSIQRQSTSWSPSPIRTQRGRNSLPPLPEMAEELIQKNLKKLKASSGISDDGSKMQQPSERKKKKKRRKKISTSISFERKVDEDDGKMFELKDFSSEKSASRKGHRTPSDQMTTLDEEGHLDRRHHEENDQFEGLTEAKSREKKSMDKSTHSKHHRDVTEESSGSSGVDDGTYSISPKRDEESLAPRRGSGTKLLTVEQLGLADCYTAIGWEVSSSPDIYWSRKEALELEKDKYFYPSSNRALITERLPPDCNEPSFLIGDELLPVVPLTSVANLARLENRILAEGCKSWFQEDGELLALPNPVMSDQCLRRPHSSSRDLPVGLLTEYRPALTGAFGKGYEESLFADVERGDGRRRSKRGCLLEVQLLSIEFMHHPLFSKEHVLAQRLLSLWTEFESRRKSGRESYLADKVRSLRAEKQALVDAITRLQHGHSDGDNMEHESHGKSNTEYTEHSNLKVLKEQLHWKLQELQKTRMERDLEGKAERKALEGVLFAWRDLKLLRKEQGYAATPLSLHLRVEDAQKRRSGNAVKGDSSEEGIAAANVEEEQKNGSSKKKTKQKKREEGRMRKGEVEHKTEQGKYASGDEGRGDEGRSKRKRSSSRKEWSKGMAREMESPDREQLRDMEKQRAEDAAEEDGVEEREKRKRRQWRMSGSGDYGAEQGYLNEAFDESNESDIKGSVLDGCGEEKQRKKSSRERRREKLKAFYLAELEVARELSQVGETSEDNERPIPLPRKRTTDFAAEEVAPADLLAEEWRQWEREVEEEVEERVEEAEALWELEMEEHRMALQELEAETEGAKKRRKRSKGKKGERAPLMEDEEKPLAPCRVDREAVRLHVEQVMRESRRPPGEPPLVLRLLRNGTDIDNVPSAREKERRFAVELTKIQARILYNGEEACRSKAVPLTQSFAPPFYQAFAIRGLGPPQSLAIELYERVRGHSAIGTAVGGWYPLALIHLPIPSRKKLIKEDSSPEWIEFGNNRVVTHLHSGVGSGIFFNPFPEFHDDEELPNLCLHLSGGIWCRLGWGISQDGVVLSPGGHYYADQGGENDNAEDTKVVRDLLMGVQRGGAGRGGWMASEGACWDRLRSWAEESNKELFQLIEELMLSRLNRVTYFCLDSMMEEFTFSKTDQRSIQPKKEGEDWWMVSRRLRVLHLRDKGVPEFRGLRCVPLSDREIPTDIFNAYEKRLSSQLTYDFGIREDDGMLSKSPRAWKGESGGCDPHEGRREWGRRCLQEARFRLLRHSHSARRLKLSDLVLEEQVPTMGSLGMTLLEWLRPRRPLRPVRHAFPFPPAAGSANPPGSKEVKVKVNVVRAFGVPVHRDIDPVLESSPWHSMASSTLPWEQKQQVDHGLCEVPVQPFVEVVLGTARARTTTALGVNPTWNQELTLTLNLETSIMERTKDRRSLSVFGMFDNSAEDLDMSTWWTSNGDINSIEDLCLTILLKDEAIIDLLVDSRAREAGEVHHRTQHHFLASLSIPLSILRFNHRLEGTFRLSSPPVLLGYTTEDTNFGSGPISGSSHLLTGSGLQPGAIYLTLFITVQPPLPALHVNFEDERALESIELPHVESHLRAWEMDVFQTMNRGCCPPKALVPDLGGRTVCATRFFRPLPPPPMLPMKWKRGSGVVAADWLARFVSMIPLSTGHQLTDIWLNSEQMLRLLCGSRVDHCILLVCLFMHLGLEVWLAQGSGLPDGPNCMFVVTRGKGLPGKDHHKDTENELNEGGRSKSSDRRWRGREVEEEEDFEEDSDWWVWDPITGQRFLTKDPFCPLQHLWCLINDQNIWANTQPSDQPQHMNFNLENGSEWWPAFSLTPPSNGLFLSICSAFPSLFGRLKSNYIKEMQPPVVGSVQPEELPYEQKAPPRSSRRKGRPKEDRTPEVGSDFYLKLLEEKLENHLQSCVMHWRKNDVTIWNRHASTLLRKLLPLLEHPMVGSPDHSVDENHLWELKNLMSSYKVCGFPINTPYDGIGNAREAVRTTGIHTINEPGVEFALAVYLHPYCALQGESSSVLSLWVYVSSLVSRSSHME